MLEINKNVEKLLNKIQAKFEPEIVPIRIESYSEVLDCYGNFMVNDFIYVSELISKLYNLGNRKSSKELILPFDVLKIITQHEFIKERLLYFIENNIKYCICGAEKSYKNCCHKILEISGQQQYELAKRFVS